MMKTRELLLKRKRELEESLSSIKESSKPVSLQDPIGRLSRMDAIQQQQMALSSKRQYEQNLRMVDAALKRFDEGTYGICVMCDEEISEKRLKARPEVALCLRCQK